MCTHLRGRCGPSRRPRTDPAQHSHDSAGRMGHRSTLQESFPCGETHRGARPWGQARALFSRSRDDHRLLGQPEWRAKVPRPGQEVLARRYGFAAAVAVRSGDLRRCSQAHRCPLRISFLDQCPGLQVANAAWSPVAVPVLLDRQPPAHAARFVFQYQDAWSGPVGDLLLAECPEARVFDARSEVAGATGNLADRLAEKPSPPRQPELAGCHQDTGEFCLKLSQLVTVGGLQEIALLLRERVVFLC